MLSKPRWTPHRNYPSNGQTLVGEEAGVQFRFMQDIGRFIASIFRAYGIDAIFSDYRLSTNSPTHDNVPGVAIIPDSDGTPRVVGELKVPWIDKHILEDAMLNEHRFRHILGNTTQNAC